MQMISASSPSSSSKRGESSTAAGGNADGVASAVRQRTDTSTRFCLVFVFLLKAVIYVHPSSRSGLITRTIARERHQLCARFSLSHRELKEEEEKAQ